jgi:hypothetical protein
MTTPSVAKNRFLAAKVAKKVKFMDLDIEILKLTVNQVLGIQDLAKEVQEGTDETANLKLLVYVIKEGAPELKELDYEEFKAFPMDELSLLSNNIMEYSGLLGKSQNSVQ